MTVFIFAQSHRKPRGIDFGALCIYLVTICYCTQVLKAWQRCSRSGGGLLQKDLQRFPEHLQGPARPSPQLPNEGHISSSRPARPAHTFSIPPVNILGLVCRGYSCHVVLDGPQELKIRFFLSFLFLFFWWSSLCLCRHLLFIGLGFMWVKHSDMIYCCFL